VASIRKQIMDAVIVALEASGGPPGLNVHRERHRPIETDQLDAILVYAEDDMPKPLAGITYQAPLTERQLTLVLEYRAKVPAGTTDDEALDPLIVWGQQQILENEKFGGLASGVDEGRTVWLTREAETTVAAAAGHFTVKYRTARADPTSKG
jgi:hypothetical protein